MVRGLANARLPGSGTSANAPPPDWQGGQMPRGSPGEGGGGVRRRWNWLTQHRQISRSGPWSATYDLGWMKIRKIKRNGPLFRKLGLLKLGDLIYWDSALLCMITIQIDFQVLSIISLKALIKYINMQPDWSCCCTPRSADIFPVVPSLQAIVVVVVIAFEEYFENLPYTCLQVLFFKPRIHTEFLVIIFVRAENRSSTLVWETRGRLLSEVFERKADFLYSQHLPKKNYSFIASRVKKNHETWWKSRFLVACVASVCWRVGREKTK